MIIIDNKPKFKKYNLVKVDSVLTFNYNGERVKYRDAHFTGLVDETSKSYHWKLKNENDKRTDENRVTDYKYSMMDIETGEESAWYEENELVLIENDGTRFLFQAEENKRKLEEQSTDLNYILSHLEDELDTTSILYLFDLIGYKCTGFLNHGEFYSLCIVWDDLRPLFLSIKNSKTFVEAADIKFAAMCIKYNISPDNVKRVFNIFHDIGDNYD